MGVTSSTTLILLSPPLSLFVPHPLTGLLIPLPCVCARSARIQYGQPPRHRRYDGFQQVGSAWKASRRHYLRVLEVGHSRIKRALMAQTVMKAASAGTVYTDFMHVYPDPGTPNLRGDRENGENCFWESLFGRVFINRTAHLSNTNQNMGISTTTGTP